MARTQPHQHPILRAALPASVTLLIVLSLVPARGLHWLAGLAHIVNTAVTPISHPMGVVARWLAPADRRQRTEEEQRLAAEAEASRHLYLRSLDEIARLRQVIESLQSRPYPGAVPYRSTVHPVVSNAGDAVSGGLRVRAGASDGVTEKSTVATTLGHHLVGRVAMTDARFCVVVPITEPAAGTFLKARIMIADAAGSTAFVRCLLTAAGDGTLSGEATVPDPRPGEPTPVAPARGMIVRLDDDAWPASAQQLIVGLVESVEPDPEQPLRPIVTVRPSVDLRRLGDVILRTPDDAGAIGEGTP